MIFINTGHLLTCQPLVNISTAIWKGQILHTLPWIYILTKSPVAPMHTNNTICRCHHSMFKSWKFSSEIMLIIIFSDFGQGWLSTLNLESIVRLFWKKARFQGARVTTLGASCRGNVSGVRSGGVSVEMWISLISHSLHSDGKSQEATCSLWTSWVNAAGDT